MTAEMVVMVMAVKIWTQPANSKVSETHNTHATAGRREEIKGIYLQE